MRPSILLASLAASGINPFKCLALPHAPAWSPILQIGQTLWSAVLLFLFLLALRNQFKIK